MAKFKLPRNSHGASWYPVKDGSAQTLFETTPASAWKSNLSSPGALWCLGKDTARTSAKPTLRRHHSKGPIYHRICNQGKTKWKSTLNNAEATIEKSENLQIHLKFTGDSNVQMQMFHSRGCLCSNKKHLLSSNNFCTLALQPLGITRRLSL